VNARDAVGADGEITIQTGNVSFDSDYCSQCPGLLPGEYAALTVSDNGKGMDKATQVRIFEPFFTTKVVGKGTGLGLATVYGIVKQNNGMITVGSSVRSEAPVISACGKETILLLEDDGSILNATASMLRRLDYEVLAANGPAEALALASGFHGPIHLLLTDVVMREMNGRELARLLLKKRTEMKCLYMSGYTANVIAHHGVLEPGVQFIQKPFSRQDLAAKVREALAS
jgi:CheY-like chemotaxis protein